MSRPLPLLIGWTLSSLASPHIAAQTVPGGGGTVRITAELVDELDQPVEGVGMIVDEGARLRTLAALTTPVVRSDARGRIEYRSPRVAKKDNMPRIRYALFAAPGFATVRVAMGWSAYRYTPWGAFATAQSEHDLGQITMLKGGRLTGRVRGAGGRPLRGARVIARELLASGYYSRFNNQGMQRPVCVSIGTTDAKGRFELPGVFPESMSLAVFAAGYYTQHVPFVSRARAIDIAMEKSGFIAGRVHNADDKPIDALLYARYEGLAYGGGDVIEQLRTKPDGSFRIGITSRGRYSIVATAILKPGEQYRSAQSKVFSRPDDGIVIELSKPTSDNPPMAIDVVDGSTGKPVSGARAAVMWQDPRHINAMGLENFFTHNARRASAEGHIQLAGPRGSQPLTGAFLVKAKGYAPFVEKKLEYDSDEPPKLKVELARESVVAGVVVDQKTGKPLAGARVVVSRGGMQTTRFGGYAPGANATPGTVTDAKGHFRVGDLGAGTYDIVAIVEGRPNSKSLKIEVKREEQRTDIRIEAPVGVDLIGKVFMGLNEKGEKRPVTLDGPWRVRLGPTAQSNNNGIFFSGFGGFRVFNSYQTTSATTRGSQLLAPGGGFRFKGLAAGRYRFNLVAPPLGKRAQPFSTSVEPLRIRYKDMQRDFDISEDLPGIVRGRVEITGAPMSKSRLFVLAYPSSRPTRIYFNRTFFRCVVEEDGTFEFRAPKGKHHIYFMDGAASTILYHGKSLIEVKSGQTANVDVTIPLTRVRVRLRPQTEGSPFVVGRLEWMTQHPGDSYNRNFGRYDQGFGQIVEGQRELLVYLPPVKTEFVVRSYLASVDPKGGHQHTPIGEAEVTPVMGEVKTVIIKVDAPEEVSADGEKKGQP